MKEILMTRIKDRMQSLQPFKSDAVVKQHEMEMAAINQKIIKAIQKESSAPVQISWLPTKSARSSFFAPIAKADLKGAFTEKIFKSSWGSVTVSGPPLNIADEGIFLGILYLVNEQKSPTVKINFKRICEILKISIQGRNYTRIKKSIWRLAQTSFIFELKDGTWSIERILSKAKGSKDYGTVEIDPWFFENYLRNEITRIDLSFRQSLRGDVCKCLYRFLTSHRGTQKYYVDTLVEALNMNPDRDIRFNRRALKSAFGQLRNRGFLSFQYDQKADMFHDIELNRKLLLSRTK
jgi:hypothetical protein